MLGLFLLYFIGKQYFILSERYNKNKWGFAILGIASYYLGTFIGGFLLGIIDIINNSDFISTTSDIVINLICLPIGLLLCWGVYKFLEYIWSKNQSPKYNVNILDDSVIDK